MTRVGLAVAAVTAMLAVVVPAWACVPQPAITAIDPRASGPGGAEVTVEGENFGDAPVELRWNGTSGEVLGTGNGPNFSMRVTVPDEAEGLYVLTALSRQPGGGVGATARTPFLISAEPFPDAIPKPEGTAPPEPVEEPSHAAVGSPSVPVLVGVALIVFAGGALAGLGCTSWRRNRRG